MEQFSSETVFCSGVYVDRVGHVGFTKIIILHSLVMTMSSHIAYLLVEPPVNFSIKLAHFPLSLHAVRQNYSVDYTLYICTLNMHRITINFTGIWTKKKI